MNIGVRKWKSEMAVCLIIFIYAIINVSASVLPLLGGTRYSESKSISLSDKIEESSGKDYLNPHQLSYLPIIPLTEKIYLDNISLSKNTDYTIDYKLGQITLNKEIKPESIIRIEYRIIPISIQKVYQRKLFEQKEKVTPEKDTITNETENKPSVTKTNTLETIPSLVPPSNGRTEDLTFSGTKSLSMSMESLKGLSINQPTRLNVNGKIANSINVSALLSDEDLPLQPEGTTEQLEDLDKILIKIEGKNLSATLGDYETSFGDTEFVLSPKMLEGAQAQGNFDIGGFTLIGAVSKGLSSSVTLQGVEGQSEYRISVNGKYIIMVAGSEQVWLNGEKMRREKDYVIRDYGDPIVEFTNKHLLTIKDVIVVDFEYVDEERNYGQKMYGARGKLNLHKEDSNASSYGKKFKFLGLDSAFGVSYATESDDKNNPIIPLNTEEIASLKRNELDPDGNGISLPAPMSSSVIGFDGKLNLSEGTFLSGEMALNKRDLNTFSTLDKSDEGKAWKLNGSSNYDKLRLNFDFRSFDSNFVPIGATAYSRSRATYQKNYDEIGFGGDQSIGQTTSPKEQNYGVDLWIEPIDRIEMKGNVGRASSEYKLPEPYKSIVDHWSRSLRIAMPNLPQIDTRYQEATTKSDDNSDFRKTRESLELSHRLLKTLNIKLKSEEIQSFNFGTTAIEDNNSKELKSQEQKLTMELPSFNKVSLSGEFSFEKEYSRKIDQLTMTDSIQWTKTSSAQTSALNLSTKSISWLDLSGYFGRRKLIVEKDNLQTNSPSNVTTNVADFKLNLKQLRINYQIDKKLSTEKEEQYVNYIITLVDGQETVRYLKPGEGSYVKIDEYTYREDAEKGDYIRLLRTVSDKPVASLAFQTVFSLRPKSSFNRRKKSETLSIKDRIIGSLSMFEVGARFNEEQDNVSKGFYLLKGLQTDKTIYGLKKYWYRTQIAPVKRLSLSLDWETGRTLNRRLNSQSKDTESDRWKAKLESLLTEVISCGVEFGKDDTMEKISSNSTTSIESPIVRNTISDISEKQKFRSLFLGFNPTGTISRIEIKGSYETERDADALSDEVPVLTKTISLGSEASFSFRGKGTTILQYEITKGTSSGELPFARYDFHNGISHKIRIETSYRLRWFTDLTLKVTYRAEIARDAKPDHRFEMEATADF
jgi:hypothetical protein